MSPRINVHGGIGTGIWAENRSATSGSATVPATAVETNGLGLVVGGRYKLNQSGRWMLNLDVLHAAEPLVNVDASVTAFQVTINIMSH